jgi:hypothetical protein
MNKKMVLTAVIAHLIYSVQFIFVLINNWRLVDITIWKIIGLAVMSLIFFSITPTTITMYTYSYAEEYLNKQKNKTIGKFLLLGIIVITVIIISMGIQNLLIR